jgi:hypothetical protein
MCNLTSCNETGDDSKFLNDERGITSGILNAHVFLSENLEL